MRFFDSHAHLNIPEFDEDREAALRRAHLAGVSRMVNVGIDAASSRVARDLAREHEGLHATAAIHPNYVKQFGEEGLKAVEDLIAEGGFVAVGETGLDYYHDYTPPEMQRAAFRRHLRLAEKADLPVVIHCRDAQEDCMAILREEAERRDMADRFIMHCFAGSAEEARAYVKLGAWISFSGIVTFPNAESVREAAAAVPVERTMIETDCPYLAPQARRGKRNEPAYVTFVGETIGAVHGLDTTAAAHLTTKNALAAFRIGEES